MLSDAVVAALYADCYTFLFTVNDTVAGKAVTMVVMTIETIILNAIKSWTRKKVRLEIFLQATTILLAIAAIHLP